MAFRPAFLFFMIMMLGSVAIAPKSAHAAPGVTTLSCTPPATDPEIASLARALNYNLSQIYEYVYYGIDYKPTFGSKKGALGAFLDRSGNNFDQNVLFVTLLRQSCITANYRYGTVSYPAASVANWLGVQNDAGVLATVLGNGAIPACVQLTAGGACVTSGAPTNVLMNAVWTEATVGSTTYELDPSFKSYTQYSPINMATATGYSQSSFLSQALSGSSSVSGLPAGVASVQSVNKANIVAQLNSYSQSLANYITANVPSNSTAQIFGGRTITNANYGMTLGAGGTLYTSLPTSFETTYTVAVSDNSSGSSPSISTTLYGSQITGRRLTLTYNASKQPVLTLEGTVLATGAATAQGAQTVSLTVNNPYAAGASFGTYNVLPTVQVGGSYAIMLAAGDIGRDTLTRHQNAVAQLTQAGQAATSEPVTGEALAAIGATYLSQSARAAQMISGIGGTVLARHEAMGVAGISSAPYVDFPCQLDGVSPQTPGLTMANEIGQVLALQVHNSTVESTTVTQMQNNPAVSTVRMFDYANSDGTGVIQGTASNWSTVQALLTGWSAADTSTIGAWLTANPTGQVYLPQKGARTVGAWVGSGYYLVAETPSSTTVAYRISGGYKGGFGTNPATSIVAPLIVNTSSLDANTDLASAPEFSAEPINLYSGAYVYNHGDMALGSEGAPFGLAFNRRYDSVNRTKKTALGWGWRHSFMISAVADSDSYHSFGDYNPLAAVQTAVYAYVASDLLSASTTSPAIGNMVAASLSASWVMDQLVNNSVKVALPDSVKKFTKIPTASGGATYVPPPGDASTLTVNANGTYTITDKAQNVLAFDAAGNIASWTDPNGNVLTFAYSGSGAAEQLTSVSNGMGRTLAFSYNASGQLTGVSDGSRSVAYTYDGVGNLSTYADATGQQTSFAYQAGGPGFLTQLFYPNFPSTAFMTNVYDAFGRVQTQADAYGNVWYYMFANGARSQEVDPVGGAHVLYYDARGNQTLDVNQVGDRKSKTYDGVGRMVAATYPNGDSIALSYDAKNNVLKKTTNPTPGAIDPLTGTAATPLSESWTYDPTFSKALTATDAKGNVTSAAYDTRGNLTTVTLPAVAKPGVSGNVAPVSSFTYGAHGLVATATDAEGRVAAYAYDPATFDLVSETKDSGRLNLKTSYAYDATGNNISVTDPNGNVTTATYDAMRRVTQVNAPASTGAITQLTYDANGNVTQSAEWNGSAWLTTTIAYDARGKATSVTAPDGTVKSKAYDTVQRVATETSSSGRQALYTYDLASRVVKITDQVAGTLDPSISVNQGAVVRQQSTFYADNLPASLIDANGNTLTYYYDGFKRLKEIAYPDSTSAAPDYDLHAFDANGNEVVFQRRDGSQIRNSYDALNRKLTKAPTNQPTISYGYDYTGNLLSAQSSASTVAYQYSYDTAGRAVGEYSPIFGWTNASLDANGNRTSLIYPPSAGSQQISAAYDALNRVTAIYAGPVTTGFRLAGYGLNPLSQRTSVSYGPAAAPVASSALAYSSAGQIASLAHNWSGSSLALSLAYNADHQRASLSASDASFLPSGLTVGSNAYTANALNQYTAVNGAAKTYDKRGNLIGDGAWTYAYDTENRLVSATTTGTSVAYGYDPLGRRLYKNVNGALTYFASFGQQELAEYMGPAGGAISLTRRFVYGPGLDEPLLSFNNSGAVTYQFSDPQGSVIALANGAGQVTEKYAYAAYGQAAVTGAGTAAYRYTGRRFDAETGLYFYRARAYSSTLGRFLQTDPIGTQGGINLYAYVGNDPVNWVDPYGLASNEPQAETGGGGQRNNNPPVAAAAGGAGGGDDGDGGDDGWKAQWRRLLARLLGQANGVAAESEALSPFTQRYLTESGGRWGGTATREQNYAISQELKTRGYSVIAGGGIGPEEYIPGVGPGTKGGAFVDITSTAPNGRTVRIQTVTTLADGVTPAPSESAAAARIRAAFPNDKLLLVPKR